MLPGTPPAQAAIEIARKLQQAGFEALLAGGCVRDLLLGREPKDYDVATSAHPAQVMDIFPRSFGVGAHFGVVLVETEQDDERVVTEIATFRSDDSYSDGRRPDAVHYTQSAEEDARRRDFTINGLFLDVERAAQNLRDAVLDFVDGLADLDTRVVRAIGAAEQRFTEDHLRLLRGVRFAARLGFGIEDHTQTVMRSMAPSLSRVSRERVRDELTGMLTDGAARRAFELLAETGMLAIVLPEAERMRGVEQPVEFHPEGDVWEHTLRLLDQLEQGCNATLAWGALLHDVGKPATFRCAPDRIRFDGHVEVGVLIAEEIAQRLRFSNNDTALIAALVANHMRFSDVMRMKDSTLMRFFRLERFAEHLALHRMDCLASHGKLNNWEYAKQRWEQLPEAAIRPARLVTGRDFIAAGFAPGPLFSAVLQTVEDAQLEGVVTTREAALELALNCLRAGELHG